jgi:hypothetical protein
MSPKVIRNAPVITLRWDPDWEEYQVTNSRNLKATYHTSDYEDAVGTAEQMRKDANAESVINKVPKSRRK